MLYIDLQNKRLALRPGTTLNMEMVNALLADGIEDSHSMPLELPVEGNEIPLGHVHQIPLAERRLQLPGAKVGHAGLPLHEGSLTVLASDSATVRTTLSAEAFVVRMGETRLRTTLEKELVDMVVESGSIAAHVVAANTAASMLPTDPDTGWTHYFPLYSNPQLYGSENSSWYPSAGDYDAARTYAADDLITYHPPGPVRRPRRYQCISATTAGQSPTSHPAKWKELAHGLVNVLDPLTGEPKTNSAVGNYYALVPWWRLRHLVLKVLAYFGVTGAGDAFAADGPLGPRSMYVLGNNTPLDAEFQDNYFHAGQTADVYYTPGSDYRQFRMPAQDDTEPAYSDPGGRWDTATSLFTPSVAGYYQFVLRVDIELPVPGILSVVARKADGSPYLPGVFGGIVYTHPGPPQTRYQLSISFGMNLSAPYVGVPLYFCLQGVAGGNLVWPTMATHAYRNGSVQGWRTLEGGVNGFRSAIRAADHVPNWSAAEFLDHVADVFNLEVVPDMERQIVAFNRRTEIVRHQGRHTTEQGDRLQANPELDHTRRTNGVLAQWEIEKGELPELDRMSRQPDVDYEHQLSTPTALQQAVLVRSTRQIYASFYRPGSGIVWEPRGYLVGKALVGEELNAKPITLHFTPAHMVEARLDEDEFIVPVVAEQGRSSFFASPANDGKAWLAIANGYSLGKEGRTYVTATSWGRTYAAAGQQPISLLLTTDEQDDEGLLVPNHFDEHHRAWWQMITEAEPVTADLLVDHAYIRGQAWRRFQVMGGQTYLTQRMPLVYGSSPGPLVSKAAYLLRIKPTLLGLSQPFRCSGPGYVSITFNGTIMLDHNPGYITYRRASDGSLHTVLDYDPAVAGPDTICVWRSDAAGNPVNDERSGFNVYGDITGIDSSGLASVPFVGAGASFQLLWHSLPQVVVPSISGLRHVTIGGSVCASVVLPSAHALIEVFLTECALTGEVVNAILANLRANNFTGTAALDGSFNAAPFGQGLDDRDHLISVNGATITTSL